MDYLNSFSTKKIPRSVSATSESNPLKHGSGIVLCFSITLEKVLAS